MSWRDWEGRGGGHVLAWNPEYVDSIPDFEEGVACARMLGTLIGGADTVVLDHAWVLFHDEWDYEVVTPEQAMDAQKFSLEAVLHATFLVRG